MVSKTQRFFRCNKASDIMEMYKIAKKMIHMMKSPFGFFAVMRVLRKIINDSCISNRDQLNRWALRIFKFLKEKNYINPSNFDHDCSKVKYNLFGEGTFFHTASYNDLLHYIGMDIYDLVEHVIPNESLDDLGIFVLEFLVFDLFFTRITKAMIRYSENCLESVMKERCGTPDFDLFDLSGLNKSQIKYIGKKEAKKIKKNKCNKYKLVKCEAILYKSDHADLSGAVKDGFSFILGHM